MKADIILEQRAIPLKREFKIIDESRSLIALADERSAAIYQEMAGLQNQIDQLNAEIQAAEKKNEGMPEAFRHLTELVTAEAIAERKPLEQALAAKKKSIALIQANLQKKIGTQYKNKTECLTALNHRQRELEQQIELLQQDRPKLIQEFSAQYTQQKAQLQSIPKLVKALSKTIIENSAT